MLVALVAIAIAVIGLGACGGDDEGGSAGSDSAQAPAAQDGVTGAGDRGDGEGSPGAGGSDGSGSGAAGSNGSGSSGSGSGAAGGGGSGGRGTGGSSGEVPPLDLDDDAPAPKAGGKDRGRAPDTSGPSKSARDFNGLARQIYESSRYFCRVAGVEGMRKEYGIESDDPKDIAEEAARRNMPRGYPEAVYWGCLEGLRTQS